MKRHAPSAALLTLVTAVACAPIGEEGPPATPSFCDAAGVERANGYCYRVTQLPSLPEARRSFSLTRLDDDRILLVGGADVYQVVKSDVYLFEPDATTWVEVADLTRARGMHRATLLPDGRVLVAGGHSESTLSGFTPVSRAELLDPDTLTWEDGPRLAGPRWGHVQLLLQDGTVLLAGGNTGPSYRDDLERLDPAAERGSMMPVPLSIVTSISAGAMLEDGRALITGGVIGDGTYGTRLTYILEGYELRVVGDLTDPRAFHDAVVLDDGRVLVAGGPNLSSVDIFDPESETFTRAAPMSQRRFGHSSVKLSDGSVLVIGGAESESQARSTEIYDPVENEWVDGPMLEHGHAATAAQVLSDGSIVVVGGCHNTGGSGSACTSAVEKIEIERDPS